VTARPTTAEAADVLACMLAGKYVQLVVGLIDDDVR
jgi:hypothetical protein